MAESSPPLTTVPADMHGQSHSHLPVPAAASPLRRTAPDSSSARPGAVMVNEPAIRPEDSAMYQQEAYGQPLALRRQSSALTFPKPLGVDEVQTLLEAIQKTKRESRRLSELAVTGDEEEFVGMRSHQRWVDKTITCTGINKTTT
jgi:hypothetical protein